MFEIILLNVAICFLFKDRFIVILLLPDHKSHKTLVTVNKFDFDLQLLILQFQ